MTLKGNQVADPRTDIVTIDEDKISEYADRVMRLAKDTVTVRFRFFDAALAKLNFESRIGLGGYVFDGENLYYDPYKLLDDYKIEASYALRLLLHVLFHGILMHPYRFDKTEEKYWNIASDIAVENIILNMEIPEASLLRDGEERIILNRLAKWVPNLTAEALYREFMVGGISKDSETKYADLFAFDRHRPRIAYRDEPKEILTKEDWEKIAERVKAELKSFSKDMTGADSIMVNLSESTKKRYDYDSILNRFAVMSEEIKVNPDEFDYIYYTYGLNKYGNMPLIEPLEYAEEKKIKEFVIAIDTSASVRGQKVTDFLNKTYDILSKSVSFSEQLNVHIVQCDAKIRSDTVIRSAQDLKDVAGNFAVKGFGATDFRPVFEYVEQLKQEDKIHNLKGLIYFTDGYGIYPESAPDYDTLFVFDGEDEYRMPVPGWAIKVVLEE